MIGEFQRDTGSISQRVCACCSVYLSNAGFAGTAQIQKDVIAKSPGL